MNFSNPRLFISDYRETRNYSTPDDTTMKYPDMPKFKGFKSLILKFLELNCFLSYISKVTLPGVESTGS